MTVNVAQMFHQRWAASEPLDRLLPAARVYTGMSFDPTLPYAAISRRSNRPAARCNDGWAMETVGLRVEVFHDDYDLATAILDAIRAAFDRTSLPLDGKIVHVQRTDDFDEQSADGVWRATIDFECTVY